MHIDSSQLIDAFSGMRVLVLGDAILDRYLEGEQLRFCREAPVPNVTVSRRHDTPGGAANTAANLSALGASVEFLAVVGSRGRISARHPARTGYGRGSPPGTSRAPYARQASDGMHSELSASQQHRVRPPMPTGCSIRVPPLELTGAKVERGRHELVQAPQRCCCSASCARPERAHARGFRALLEQAKALGDILVVAVNDDASIRGLKGPGRPINTLEDRIQVLAALGCVDHVIGFQEDTCVRLVEALQPHIFVKGGDYTRETLPEAGAVEAAGGQVHVLPYVSDRSTTGLIQRIQHRQPDSHAAVGLG